VTQAETRTYAPVGWDGLDAMLEAVQREHPATAGMIVEIRGELAGMRYLLGTEPESPEHKQRQTVRDALAFEPSTAHAAFAVVTQVTDMRRYGFTGSFCPDCGGTHMVRAGTCESCSDCGATTGCS